MLPPARLDLRLLSSGDVAAVEAVYGDPETMVTMPWRLLADRAGASAWVAERASEQSRTGFGMYLVRDHVGTLIGFCGYIPRGEELEIGWVIHRRHWGQGFATEAVAAVLDCARDQPVFAAIRPGNLASIRVAEKVGLRFDHESGDEYGALLVYRSCNHE